MIMSKFIVKIYKSTLVLMLIASPFGAFINAQCNPNKYAAITKDAKGFLDNGELLRAKNNFEAAVIFACSQTEILYIESEIDKIFIEINRMRRVADSIAISSQRLTQRYFANELAYKAQLALTEGDYSTSLKLIEFASIFSDSLNEQVIKTNSKIFYNTIKEASEYHPVWKEKIGEYELITPNGQNIILINGTTVLFRPINELYADTISNILLPVKQITTDSGGAVCALLHFDTLIQICKGGLTTILKTGTTKKINQIRLSLDGQKMIVFFNNSEMEIFEIGGGTFDPNIYEMTTITTKKIEIDKEYLHSVESAFFSLDSKSLTINYSPYSQFFLKGNQQNYFFDSTGMNSTDFIMDINKNLFENITHLLEYEQHYFTASTNEIIVKRPSYYPVNLEVLDSKSKDKIGNIPDSNYGRLFFIGESSIGLVKESYIKIWKIEENQIILMDSINIGHIKSWQPIAWNNKLSLIAYIGVDGNVIVYDFNYKKKYTLPTHGDVSLLRFVNDGKVLMTSPNTIWHLDNFDFNLTKNNYFIDRAVEGLCFSPTGNYLANSKILWGIVITDVIKGDVKRLIRTNDFYSYMKYLDEEHILCLGRGLIIKEISTGMTIDSIGGISESSHRFTVSKNNDLIAVYGKSIYDNTFRLFKIDKNFKFSIEKEQKKPDELRFLMLDFSINEEQMAIINRDGLHVLSISDFNKIKFFPEYESKVSFLQYTPDGKHLAIIQNNTIKLISVSNWEIDNEFTIPEYSYGGVISSCGKFFVYFSHGDIFSNQSRKSLRFLSLKDGQIFTEIDIKLPPDKIHSFLLSPKGAQFATISDYNVYLFDLNPIQILDKSILNDIQLRLPWFSAEEIEKFELNILLDLKQGNEDILKSRYDINQILAFADMYSKKISNDSFLESDYQRALRLYQHCLNSTMQNTIIEEKILNLESKYNALKKRG